MSPPFSFHPSITNEKFLTDFYYPQLTLAKISEVFPKALGNKKLVSKVSEILKPHGFGTTTQLATSLCCDELSRPLERDFGEVYGQNFSMGGLAGFPFGGVTSK